MGVIVHAIGCRVYGLTRKYEAEQNCKRKTVVTVAYRRVSGGVQEIGHWVNHPIDDDPTRCTDEVGGCGCLHSEPQAICAILRAGFHFKPEPIILAVTYSPCTPCANIIAMSLAVHEVYWLEDTRHDMRGIEILKQTVKKAERIDP